MDRVFEGRHRVAGVDRQPLGEGFDESFGVLERETELAVAGGEELVVAPDGVAVLAPIVGVAGKEPGLVLFVLDHHIGSRT